LQSPLGEFKVGAGLCLADNRNALHSIRSLQFLLKLLHRHSIRLTSPVFLIDLLLLSL
jgi:hypothetical protein